MDMEDIYQRLERARIDKGLSQAEVSRRAFGKSTSAAMQNIRRGNIPSVEKLEAIGRVLGFSLSFEPEQDTHCQSEEFGNLEIPLKGFAKCSPFGSLTEPLKQSELPAPIWLDDPSAFWVQALGQSMRPEGIRAGDFCLVSPAEPLTVGSRVYINDVTQEGPTIKRLLEIEEDRYHVRGWHPIEDGHQDDFEVAHIRSCVTEIYTIVADYRGRPGSTDPEPRYIPDPRTELGGAPNLLPVELVTPPDVPMGVVEPKRMGFDSGWLQRMGAIYATTIMVMCPDQSVSQSIPEGASVLVSMASGEYLGPGIYLIDLPDGSRSFRRVEELDGGGHILRADDGRKTAVLSPRDVKSGMLVGKAVWFGTEVT